MIDQWEKMSVYDVPIWTRPFMGLCGLGGLAILFVTYRELAGLGPVSGMTTRMRGESGKHSTQ
jgi:hypothetical protein